MAGASKEGKDFLAGAGHKDGEAKTRSQVTSPPKVIRQSTMQATAKEAEDFVGSVSHGRTRSATRRSSEGGAVEQSPPKKPAMKRAGTMAATAKEGKEFLKRQKEAEDNKETADAEPANSTTEEATAEPEVPDLKRAGTMVNTAQEAKAILGESAPAGATRAESAALSTVLDTSAEKRDHADDDTASDAKRVKE